jgi:hypothetical protein
VSDDKLQAAWRACTESWSETARHDALLQLGVAGNTLAWVAARYRERASDPIAQAQLEKIRKAAVAAMMVTATAKPEKDKSPYRSLLLVLGALVLAILFAFIATQFLAETKANKSHQRPTKPARR